MICPNCGQENPNDVLHCNNCNCSFHQCMTPQTNQNFEYSEFVFSKVWKSIWLNPRSAIQYVLESNHEKYILFLGMTFQINFFLGRIFSLGLGDKYPILVIPAIYLVVGAISGLLWFYILSYGLHWITRHFGGKATSIETRAAIAWSYVPYTVLIIVLMVFWLIMFLLTGIESNHMEYPPSTGLFVLMLTLVLPGLQKILGMWSFGLMVICISEVNDFSLWRSFGCVLFVDFIQYISNLLLVWVLLKG